jgi:autotransporter-associated beta strand protein
MPRLNADPGGDPQAVVDLSPLNSFTYNAGTSTGELRVGFGGNLQGTLRLAAISNMITARIIQVGNSNNQNNGGTSLLALGGGTNQIQANTINIGSGKSPAIFNFQGINGSITIAGQTTATADIAVGTASSATASTTVSTMNFDGHLANVQAGTLIVGRLSGSTAGLGGGSVLFDTGLFNVANLQMAVHSSGGTNAATSALLTIGGPFPNDTATGNFNVASQFLLVNRTSTAGTTATSTFTVNGGTANIVADILIVDNSPAAARNTTLTLAGGMLNMMGHSIATGALLVNVVNLPGFGQTATLANLGGMGINGAGLEMNGAGTLILSGANTYTGATTVTGGTLAVSGTLSGTTAVNVSGGTLRLGVNNPLNDSGALTLGNGTFDSGGFSDTLGTFALNGTGTLDLGAGTSILHFADSSNNSPAWTGTLSITNWNGSSRGGGADQMFFGNNGSGLAAAQVARIIFVNPFGPGSGNMGAKILATGEIVAIPEPGSIGLLTAALAATAALGRKPSRGGPISVQLLYLLLDVGKQLVRSLALFPG